MAAIGLKRLRSLGDPAVRASSRRFFKQSDAVRFFGVRAGDVRRLARELRREAGSAWGVAEALGCCDILMREPALEAKALGILMLGRFRDELRPPLLGRVRRWVLDGHAANWATIDTLAPHLVTPVLERWPVEVRRMRRWARSRDMWLRRAAVVAFVPLASRGLYLATVYALVAELARDEADLLQKACGWLLREAGKADPARLERFLLTKGQLLARTTVRYAIERYPETRRRALLRRTRARTA